MAATAILDLTTFAPLKQKALSGLLLSDVSLTIINREHNATFHCIRVLRQAPGLYAQSIQERIGQEAVGSKEFWRITNKVLGRGKAPILAKLFNAA